MLGLIAEAKGPGPKFKMVKHKAKSGDGAMAILRKYGLATDAQTMANFFAINNLEFNAELKIGQEYNLPIEIKKFNGINIRSSLGIKDYDAAKAIELFNKKSVANKLKAKDYTKDKLLWVPLKSNAISTNALSKKSGVQELELVAVAKLKTEEVENKKEKSDIKEESNIEKSDSAEVFIEDEISNEEKAKRNKRDLTGKFSRVSSSTMRVPLFGPGNDLVKISDNKLEGQVFYIVPGHGGPDPGAIVKNYLGKYDLCEDEYAYDVCLRLAKKLIEDGAIVHVVVQDKNDGIRDEKYLDCDEDEICSNGYNIPISQKKRLKQGMTQVNHLFRNYKRQGFKKQWMVSIHIDSRPEDERQDVFFYYYDDSEASKKQATRIQEVFTEKYTNQGKDYSGSVSTRPLYVLRASDPEPIFIELANIRNEKDRQRILIPRNRQLLAEWIAEGFY